MEKNLLVELQEYVEAHLNILVFDVFETEIFEVSNMAEAIQNSEIVDFIKNNRKPNLYPNLVSFY